MNRAPPADTHDRGQRGSRPVLFDPTCELWRGARDGLIVSNDLNERLEFEPIEAAAGVAAGVAVLARELRALEQENVVLRKHAELQHKVISGMCNLQAFERENRPPNLLA